MMENDEIRDLSTFPSLPRGHISADGFPSLSKSKDTPRRRIFVRRPARTNSQPAQSLSPTCENNENDEFGAGQSQESRVIYRRLSSKLRSGRRSSAQMKVPVPLDTIALDAMRLDTNYTPLSISSIKSVRRSDHSRCPTPMPGNDRTCWTGKETSKDYPDFLTPRPQTQVNLKCTINSYQEIPPHELHVSEQANKQTSVSPGCTLTPTSPVDLTENVLNHYCQGKVDRNKRIVRWLVDCDEKTGVSSLPAHLPDISMTQRKLSVSP